MSTHLNIFLLFFNPIRPLLTLFPGFLVLFVSLHVAGACGFTLLVYAALSY